MTIFTCQDTFEAMMTCVYEAWASRLGHSNVRLMTEPCGTMELFCDYRHVDTRIDKAQSVIRSIRIRISAEAYRMVYRAAMSDQEDKLDTIYRFIAAGFHYGPDVVHYLQEPVIMRMQELNRRVTNESHLFREFIRFDERQHRILVSVISPKCNVLTLLAPAFADRMPSEDWMIIDDIRKQAVVHPRDEDYYLTPLSDSELQELAKQEDDPVKELWTCFFESTAIQQRKNPACQRSHMPIWYRKHMTEWQ